MFHEKQEGQLCAQHALNSLLQGSYFSPIDLADLAQQLDAQEADSNIPREENNKSGNYDDSGYFSIQVLQKALEIWNLELHPIGSVHMKGVLENPLKELGFICNLENHWFILRRFGSKSLWYNLNSVLDEPEYVSDTYLSLLLTQLKSDGYHIFVVKGELPQCEADDEIDFSQDIPYRTKKNGGSKGVAKAKDDGGDDEDDLEKAIAMSLGAEESTSLNSEEALLQAALAASLESYSTHKRESEPDLSVDELRRKRLSKFA